MSAVLALTGSKIIGFRRRETISSFVFDDQYPNVIAIPAEESVLVGGDSLQMTWVKIPWINISEMYVCPCHPVPRAQGYREHGLEE